MEKQTYEKLEARMDAVIEKLVELPVTDKKYDDLMCELRELEAKMAAMTAKKPNFSVGMEEFSTRSIAR